MSRLLSSRWQYLSRTWLSLPVTHRSQTNIVWRSTKCQPSLVSQPCSVRHLRTTVSMKRDISAIFEDVIQESKDEKAEAQDADKDLVHVETPTVLQDINIEVQDAIKDVEHIEMPETDTNVVNNVLQIIEDSPSTNKKKPSKPPSPMDKKRLISYDICSNIKRNIYNFKKYEKHDSRQLAIQIGQLYKSLKATNITIEDDEKLTETLQAVARYYQGQAHLIKMDDIIIVLRILFENHKEDTFVIETLLLECMSRVRRSISSIEAFRLMNILMYNHDTPNRAVLYQQLKQSIESRLEEISQPKDYIQALYLFREDKSSTAMEQLYTLAPPVIEMMTANQLYKFLTCTTSLQLNPPISIISQAISNLKMYPFNFDAKKLVVLFKIFCKYNIGSDVVLLEELSKNTENALKEATEDSIGSKLAYSVSVLKSCSLLGWSYTSLTSEIMKNISQLDKLLEMPSSDLAVVVNNICKLQLIEYGDLALKIAEHIESKQDTTPLLWFNVVHSLATIGIANKSMIKAVLEPANIARCCSSEGRWNVQDMIHQRALHLQGCLCVDLGSSEGILDGAESKQWLEALQQEADEKLERPLIKQVASAVTCLAPLDGYVNRNIVHKYGYVIDFELFVNEKGKAKRLSETEGMTRIGIVVQGINDLVYGGEEVVPNGKEGMALRHMVADERHIITVPLNKWKQCQNQVSMIKFIDQLIRKKVMKFEDQLPSQNIEGNEAVSAETTEDK